ncbi:phosphotransferase [Nocardioides sp. GY 10127]|uniref:phosphotransferase enzyme family protein n=1 Tax=Nocardioides sp. GY 10127 TaxID=2569762 RepID=UPI0010A8A88F|nr:phosphotransferase [Nocardioides sp. GY 10127]TIC79319.1 phosphotransferase [Nocardioides sp. GY 10127]
MTAPASADPLAVFAALERGAAAPTWLARGIAEAWLPHGDAGGESDVRLLAVSENATFVVRVAGAPTLVVRVHRPGYVDLDQVRSELWWVDAVAAETPVATPAPVRGLDGALVQEVRDDAGTTWTAIGFAFVPGLMLEDVLGEGPDDAVPWFGPIGEVVATLHAHARSWERPAGFSRFTWGLDDLVGPAARWGRWRVAALDAPDLRVLEEAERSALTLLADVPLDAREWGLVHGDLRPSNLMVAAGTEGVAPDAGRLTVIDFDDCGLGYYLYDLAAAVSFYEHLPQAPAMARAWVEGYTAHAPLTRRDLDVAGALSMLRRLTLLGWTVTHREDALPPDLAAAMLPGTVEVGARYLADPRWLLG